MKSLLRALLQPVPLALTGLLASGLLIWWVGPLVAIAGHMPLASVTARAAAIALLLLAVALRIVYRRVKASSGEASLLRRLLGRNRPAEPAEVQRLRQGLEQALRQLDQSQPRPADRLSRLLGLGQRRQRDQRPWYLLLGAPGSGKTSAVVHCGLAVTRCGQEDRPSGIRPGCDWWCSDEAVLLDTAGRYSCQDAGQASDREGWLGLLGLLRQQRPGLPLKGVILTLSATELLEPTEATLARQAQALRARLQELERVLGLRLPVYLLLTKADLIAGFEPFFATLDQAGRDQVWGCTLSRHGPEAADPVRSLAPRLDALRERLQDQLLARLQEEPELDRRGAIAGFDQQFAACCRQLLPWVQALCAASEQQPAPMLRGVYFCSAVQQGQALDTLRYRLGQACGLEWRGLPSWSGQGRSYFLRRLLRELVFAEQQLAALAPEGIQRRQQLRLGLLIAMATLGLALLAGWTLSYRNNSRYVAQVDQAVAAARPLLALAAQLPAQELAGLLPLLEAVANVSTTPTRTWGEPGDGMGLGLSQGDKLDAAASQASGALQRELLLPRISQRLVQQLREPAGNDPEFSYQALKAYLMLHEPAHFDPAELKAWILRDSGQQGSGGLNASGQAMLERQLDALFAAGPPSPAIPLDQALVDRSRRLLLSEPLSRRIYQRIRREGMGSEIADFSLLRAAGPEAALVFARRSGKPLGEPLPGLYTRAGYRQGLAPALERLSRQLTAEANWVLGPSAGLQQVDPALIAEQVRELYLQDYARTWEALLADLMLRPSTSLAQSVQLARLLSSPDSPLLKLVTAVVQETTLAPAAVATADPAGSRLDQARAQLGRLFGHDKAALPSPDPAAQRLVDERFAALRQLVAGEPQAAPIQAMLQRLDEFYLQLAASEAAIRDRLPVPADGAGSRLKAESARLPDPLRQLLPQLADMAMGQQLGATRQRLSAELGQQIGSFCRLATEGRYPFLRSSPRDVTPEDFARLFGPGGLFDQFFQQQLAPHVDRSSRPWRFRQPESFGNPGQLAQFERAAIIRDVFFGTGLLRLDFKLLEADPLAPPALEIDGQRLQFDPAQPRRQAVQWQGPRNGLRAELQLGSERITAEGPWALLRLLDRARLEPLGAPEQFKASFEAGSQRASFEVTAASVRHPLRLRELAEFRCPQGL